MIERGLVNIDEKCVKCEHLNGIYERLADLIGIDNVIRIYQEYRGQQINFPVRLFSRHYVRQQVAIQYDGSNINTLQRESPFDCIKVIKSWIYLIRFYSIVKKALNCVFVCTEQSIGSPIFKC